MKSTQYAPPHCPQVSVDNGSGFNPVQSAYKLEDFHFKKSSDRHDFTPLERIITPLSISFKHITLWFLYYLKLIKSFIHSILP